MTQDIGTSCVDTGVAVSGANSVPKVEPALSGFRPMLSAKFGDADVADLESALSRLHYPLLASPKLDGIRVVCHPQLGPVTRTLKPVPNHHIRTLLSLPILNYLDGEVIVGDHTASDYSFQRTTSAVMSRDGILPFTYVVFDCFRFPTFPFTDRQADYVERCRQNQLLYVTPLAQMLISHPKGVLNYEEACLAKGYEGAMLRSPASPYKFGRSTLKEEGLIKLKRFEDAEAEITGYTELTHNDNPPEADNFGLQRRSSHKANQRPGGTLGTLVVRGISPPFAGVPFEVGSGFDFATRDQLWGLRDTLPGKIITFKYQPHGVKDKPRSPIFKSLRHD
jgi:DNA ligase 1